MKLWLGPSVVGHRLVSLSGRVVRRRYDEAAGEWSVALRFMDVSGAMRGRLDFLLERRSVGPTTPLNDGPTRRAASRLAGLWDRGELAAKAELERGENDDEASELQADRRARVRGVFGGEVVGWLPPAELIPVEIAPLNGWCGQMLQNDSGSICL